MIHSWRITEVQPLMNSDLTSNHELTSGPTAVDIESNLLKAILKRADLSGKIKQASQSATEVIH